MNLRNAYLLNYPRSNKPLTRVTVFYFFLNLPHNIGGASLFREGGGGGVVYQKKTSKFKNARI